MKNILLIAVFLILALAGFSLYIHSGEELQEELILHDEPEILEAPSVQDQAMIEDMLLKAGEMSDQEKKAAEKKIVDMLNPPETQEHPIQKTPSLAEKAAKKGNFTETDFIHKGSGQALVFPNAKEGPTLRLENFSVTRGPDLYVYLSENINIKENGLGEWVSLGLLKSPKGNQNYPLPENWNEYRSVLIWCQAFSVLFSEAELR